MPGPGRCAWSGGCAWFQGGAWPWGGLVPACLAGFQTHTQGGSLGGSDQEGEDIQAHTQGGS